MSKVILISLFTYTPRKAVWSFPASTLHCVIKSVLIAHQTLSFLQSRAKDFDFCGKSNINLEQAWDAGIKPVREFMSAQIDRTGNSGDVWLFYKYMPAGTPTPVLTRLHGATVAALALPEVREKLSEQGGEVVGNNPAELAAYVAAEIPKWAALGRQAGLKPE